MAKIYDVIVVGSGAAGGWAAKELSESGMQVLLLEAGRDIDDKKDFPENVNWESMSMWSRIEYALRGQMVQARNGVFCKPYSHFYVNDRENPYTTPKNAPFQWSRGRQVGGRMHTWGRAALRMSDFDFRRPDLDPELHANWPISYEEIAPYYSAVEETLGIIGDKDGLEKIPDGVFMEDSRPISNYDKFYADLLKNTVGLNVIRGRVVKYNPGRIPLTIVKAKETGNCKIQSDSVVRHVLVDNPSGKAKGVGYIDRLTGIYKEALSNYVILSASAFESVRILMNSTSSRFPKGIGYSSGVLGRYIHDHVFVSKGGRASEDYLERVKENNEEQTEILNGISADSEDQYDNAAYMLYVPNFCHNLQEKPDFVGGYGIQTSAYFGYGDEKHWVLNFFGQMLPSFDNCLNLNPKKKDKWGIPVLDINVKHRENEIKMAKHMNQTAQRIGEKINFKLLDGAGTLKSGSQKMIFRLLSHMIYEKSGAFIPGYAIHETGGARMGDDPENSVVNKHNSCWDVPNLYITDGSCFPSNGCQNHTLTIMAITVRACEHIVKQK